MAHTPGPWTIASGGNDTLTIAHYSGDGLGSHIARLDRRWLCDEHGGTIEANANLIVAAPELLEALKSAAAFLEYLDDVYPLRNAEILNPWRECTAAITKATE